MDNHQSSSGKRFQGTPRDVYLALGIGCVIGILIMLLLGLGLYSGGNLWLGALPTVATRACPATPDLGQVCPPVMALSATPTVPTRTPTPTLTSTLTPTPNLAATATAACADFESKFPGTPCPE